jgi:hypothetical protein
VLIPLCYWEVNIDGGEFVLVRSFESLRVIDCRDMHHGWMKVVILETRYYKS